MLQPQQLESVAKRFSLEIEILRGFFRGTECLPHGFNSLAAVAAELHVDDTFRRDLALHLMAFAHDGASSADLLGIIALATADASSASAARAEDAHEVLRFILASVPSGKHNAYPLNARRVETPHARYRAAGWAWPVAAVCLVAGVVLVTNSLRHRTPAEPQPVPLAASPRATATQPVTQAEVQPQAVAKSLGVVLIPAAPLHRFTPYAATPAPLQSTAQPQAGGPGSVPARTVQRPLEASTGVASSADLAAQLQPAPSSPAIEARVVSSSAAHSVMPTATPATVLSQRLDARTLPATDPAIDPASGRPYPRLWRRQPMGPPTPENATLLAANVAPSRPGSFAANTQPTSAGTVRPVSLGMMAANILYSPAPTYPAAAAAARVQGQVTIQAEVDRDGSVASARVVSGPPLLRDAALDAVLRWRYRPRTVAGKPVTAADTAVVEFELP